MSGDAGMARGKARRPYRRTNDGYQLRRGDPWRSYKRDVRRALEQRYAVTSARQWIRLRKRLAREERGRGRS